MATIYSNVYRTKSKGTKKQQAFKPISAKLLPKVASARDGALDYQNARSGATVAPVSVDKPKPVYEGKMLERELKAQKEVEYKKTCVAPLHKSNYVYVTEGMNPAGFGRKNEVL